MASDTLKPVAHEALLRARDENKRLISPASAFMFADSPKEAVYFDRLCRMVHTLNFFNQSGAKGDLYLNVSGRHLLLLAVAMENLRGLTQALRP